MKNCRKLFWHVDRRAASRTKLNAGSKIAARIATIAITTSISTSVKPFFCIFIRSIPVRFGQLSPFGSKPRRDGRPRHRRLNRRTLAVDHDYQRSGGRLVRPDERRNTGSPRECE
jgi:hypothetical protein